MRRARSVAAFKTVKHLRAAAAMVVFVIISTPTMGFGDDTERGKRYNVLLITVNSLRYDHLGSSGYPKPTTPAMDEFAGKSFVFSNAFAQAGYTMPSMMTMFTSLYPGSHNVMDPFKDKLSSKVKTLAEVFRENSYATAGFWEYGVAHLDVRAGFGRGFDMVGDLRPDFFGRQALLDWIREKRDRAFFLALNMRSTHVPLVPLPRYRRLLVEGKRGNIINSKEDYDQAVYQRVVKAIQTPGSSLYGVIDPEKRLANSQLFEGNFSDLKWKGIIQMIPAQYRHRIGIHQMKAFLDRVDLEDAENMKYLRSLYDACILGVDQELVKPILKLLEELHIDDRTIVIITADHGFELGEHGKLGPGKRYWDEMIHVPLLIKTPWMDGRRDIDDIVQTVDLMPTILELAGIPIPVQAQGRSLAPIMREGGGKQPEKAVFGSTREQAYIRTRKWKLVVQRELMSFPESKADELYNLAEDPEERVNVRNARPGIYRKLRVRLQNHLTSLPLYADGVNFFPEYIDSATRKRIRETGYW